jgi:hypothetical protein
MAEVERIKAEAIAAYPKDPVAAAKAANTALEQRALSVHSIQPREIAALVFLGYYSKNEYEIPSVCKEQAVDLTAFANAFAEANRSSLEAASHVVDSKALIDRARPSANKNARAELGRFASAQQTDLKGACSFIEEHSVKMANGAKFANIMPTIYEQLVEH